MILKGKHVTADDVYEEVLKAEETTRRRKVKKPRKTKPLHDSSSSDEDSDLEINIQAQDREIAHCIVVQF